MVPSDQLLLDCFNSKLQRLYEYSPTSQAAKGGQGAVNGQHCALNVCTLLRTYTPQARTAGETYILDFDPPKLEYDQIRDEYQLKISIRSFNSPTGSPCPATGSFKVDLVQKKYQLEEGGFQGPTAMVMHTLVFQDAERRSAEFQSAHDGISKNVLKEILHDYVQSLHEGGISTLLAQACPSLEIGGQPPVIALPRPAVTEPRLRPLFHDAAINIYVKMIWQIIVEKLQGGKEDNTVKVFTGRRIPLTFSGPPTVSYDLQSGGVIFNFEGFASTDGLKGDAPFSLSFTVGTLVPSENQGVFTTQRINIDHTRPSCNHPHAVPEQRWMIDVIVTIRDEYIPFLWECGFDTVYASLDWNKTLKYIRMLPTLPKVSHDPLMHSWDFVVAISQESVNTQLVTGNAVHYTVPRQDPGEASVEARFAASRIELLSNNQAILWVCVNRDLRSNGKVDRHQPVISETVHLAFHVHLKMKSSPPVAASGHSVWEIYFDTANVSFLPQYSVLAAHEGEDDREYHTLWDLVNFTKATFIPSLSANKQKVIARIPILGAAIQDSTPYIMVNAQFRTAFGRPRANMNAVTVENWHETISQPRAFSPILLVYGTQPDASRTPATPPSWNSWSPHTHDIKGLSTGTLAIAKDVQVVERAIPAQLARLNAITALVPTVHLWCSYSCPGTVYLESSGDGRDSTVGKWQPWQPADCGPFESRTYVFQSTSSCATTTFIDGATRQKQTYTCKTVNKLTMSNLSSPELAITMTGNIELSCSDSKATASLTWKWDIIEPGGPNFATAKSPSAEKLLSSLTMTPSVPDEVPGSGPRMENMSTEAQKSKVMARRLKAAFRTIIKHATLPDPIAGMPAFRYNENGDLLVELYSQAPEDAHPGMNGYRA
ncbi:hypothetical protein GY45DRAFT_1325812 [Cubamyces sp. BRFM 1775]|nr:hypothetical protein GY45DRAFT_1325812 [Cubamyces sp. BRFM 1775]